MKILVTGGAGYIGSHVVKMLLQQTTHEVFVIDNLSTGHRDAVLTTHFLMLDLADVDALHALFKAHQFDLVLHFAASSIVAESIHNPDAYYANNVTNTINLLDCMVAYGVKKIIFSSTAAVYGKPVRLPIDLAHPLQPVSPYGMTKKVIEEKLCEYAVTSNLQYVVFRYFNAAGADPEGELAERHCPETHLIPLVLDALMSDEAIKIYGDDYQTPDGTAIRDYIHVQDICAAYLKGIEYLNMHHQSQTFNLGTGQGHSVLEVIKCAKQVTGKDPIINVNPRRSGDPDVLVASAKHARHELQWVAQYGLKEIIKDAWQVRDHL